MIKYFLSLPEEPKRSTRLYFIHKDAVQNKESVMLTWTESHDLEAIQINIEKTGLKLAMSITNQTNLSKSDLNFSLDPTLQKDVDYHNVIADNIKEVYVKLKQKTNICLLKTPDCTTPALPVSGCSKGLSHHRYVEFMSNKPINPLRDISSEELALHNKENDCWIAINGIVYDITSYLDYHPGGREILIKNAGTDASNLFYTFHPWVNHHLLLEKNTIGFLKHKNKSKLLGFE